MNSSFRMIDVGAKAVTQRVAVACGDITVGKLAFDLIVRRALPKGDALLLAEVAGIQGAKGAHQLLPLCHPLGLDQVTIRSQPNPASHAITIYCIASTHAKTGVEMEALAGVNAALLTLWDLTKMVEPNLTIGAVRLLLKMGGKSGRWHNPDVALPPWLEAELGLVAMPAATPSLCLAGRRVAVITLSDRAHRGEYQDRSGAVMQERLQAVGAELVDYAVIPDEFALIQEKVRSVIERYQPDLLITTGGTGLAARDVTPDALAPLFSRTIPGIGELLRSDGSRHTPLSWASRATAGLIGSTLVITLPGNPKAVAEGLDALLPHLLPHLLRIIKGES